MTETEHIGNICRATDGLLAAAIAFCRAHSPSEKSAAKSLMGRRARDVEKALAAAEAGGYNPDAIEEKANGSRRA